MTQFQMREFNYSDYVNHSLDLVLIEAHLHQFIPYFSNCQHVLDIGSGNGIFLKHLQEVGIKATGIENDLRLVAELQRQSLNVIQGDAASIWSTSLLNFDGVFCSHLIEHLTFDQVIALIEGLATQIAFRGVVVFAFPNPESLEMQLFHFWRDPQHVRFYHPDLICGLLRHYGFEIQEVFSQGTWGPMPSQMAATRHMLPPNPMRFPPIRRLGRLIKTWLGITALEVEADYVRKLREIGREVVIVARKGKSEEC